MSKPESPEEEKHERRDFEKIPDALLHALDKMPKEIAYNAIAEILKEDIKAAAWAALYMWARVLGEDPPEVESPLEIGVQASGDNFMGSFSGTLQGGNVLLAVEIRPKEPTKVSVTRVKDS